jgi:hypothetical protein
MAKIGIAQTQVTGQPAGGGGGGSGTVTNTSGNLTAHAVVVGNGSADEYTLSALGTSGQVLTSNGASADPSWQAAGAGSAPFLYQGWFDLPGLTIVDPGTFNPTYGSATSVYAVPSGKRAMLVPYVANPGTLAATYQWQIEISSTYYNLTASTQSAVLATGNTSVQAVAYIAEAGETFSITTNAPTAAPTQVIVGTAVGPFSITAVSAPSSGVSSYTGTFTGGASSAFKGFVFTVTGCANAANNGTFVCLISSATILSLSNPSSVVASAQTASASSSTSYATYVVTSLTAPMLGLTGVVSGFTNAGNNASLTVPATLGLSVITGGNGFVFSVALGSQVNETHAGTLTFTGALALNVFSTILLFNNTAGTSTQPNVKTVKLTSMSSGANTLYTVGAGLTAYVAGMNPMLALGSLGTNATMLGAQQVYVMNPTPLTYSANFVRTGGSVSTANYIGGNSTNAPANIPFQLPSVMNAGDFININSSSSAAGQFAWVSVWEF